MRTRVAAIDAVDGVAAALNLDRQQDVVERRSPRQQQRLLEHEAGAQIRLSRPRDPPAARLDQPRDRLEQCRLAATARPQQRHELAAPHRQAQPSRPRSRCRNRSEGLRSTRIGRMGAASGSTGAAPRRSASTIAFMAEVSRQKLRGEGLGHVDRLLLKAGADEKLLRRCPTRRVHSADRLERRA